jgi:dTDP-4-amino-4,6-dideoxygalactose transaminase
MPVINKEMKKAAIQVLENEMLVGGESVLKFEEDFAKYIGTDYAISTNSGSSALLLAFNAIDTKNGDNIVAPSATFVATVNGACILEAKPIFCEIGHDYVISSEQIEIILNKNEVKCIIPVHLYGHPCDMSSIKDTAKKKKVIIIEDAAQAHGAQHMNMKVGSFGEAAIFSFYPTKNMTVGGDGGMITTNSKKIYESAFKMRDVGRKTKYTHDKIGYTLRLNSVNASIGKVQLKCLDTWNEKRRKIAMRYRKKLEGIGDLILPPDDETYSKSVYHMYVIRTKKRNLLGTWLSKNGISTGVHYPLPVHRQPAYRKFVRNILTFTDEWSRTVLSIPIHPNLDPHDQEFIINIVTRFYDERLYEQKELQDEEKSWSARLI